MMSTQGSTTIATPCAAGLSLLFVVSLLLCHSTAEWVGCGGACANNNYCDDALCSDCVSGTCQPGGGCNTTCTVDSDCERLRYCYLCVTNGNLTGTCQPGPIYPYRCPFCSTNSDCDQSSPCSKCTPTTLWNRTIAHVCAAGCGSTCKISYDCGYGTTCSSCDQVTQTCQNGGGCGSTCGTDADCDQSGKSPCSICISNTCSVPCGAPCKETLDCNGPITGCGTCSGGACQPGTQCGSRCLSNSDCNNSTGGCTACTNGQCAPGVCEIKQCTPGNNNNCDTFTCSYCDPFLSRCRLGGPCGTACIVDTDCNQLGTCTRCANVCIKPDADTESVRINAQTILIA